MAHRLYILRVRKLSDGLIKSCGRQKYQTLISLVKSLETIVEHVDNITQTIDKESHVKSNSQRMVVIRQCLSEVKQLIDKDANVLVEKVAKKIDKKGCLIS